MTDIHKAARRLSGMDWDNWPDASILPSGTRPVIADGTDDDSVALYGSERGNSTVVVAIRYKDWDGKFSYCEKARTVDEDSVGTIEQVEEEQTELFNEIVNDYMSGHSSSEIMGYYGLDGWML